MNELLVVKNLKKYFKTKFGLVKAVDGITFHINEGETFALVGESGSGKSTTGHMIVGMYAPTSGEIYYKMNNISVHASKRPKNITREIQVVFQDPASSLNPSRYIKDIIGTPLKVYNLIRNSTEVEQKVADLLENVELPPELYMYRKPRELGGGELQAIAIARALSTNPKLIILDEPTSALDVITQAKIINLLLNLQKKHNLTYLFITHDLAVVRNIASRVAVMYLGKIVETAPTIELFNHCRHPYSMMLFSSIPVISEDEKNLKPKKITSIGEIPSSLSIPPGCRFHTRCPYAEARCKVEEPSLKHINSGHIVACHLAE
ncbi:MAG: ABC transporter ATP-binding protein [Aigarchaeota archaeon]|nr:ABC transporter ATP-binding protein [Aigarchaeota archaeon]MCX7795979.1 ABC transporter ATP-binding protein [bacterium]MDW7985949.1 ABC transporter ATP-binding protein [Nitrososphaerota archaeon]